MIRYFNGKLKTYVAEMCSALIIKVSAQSDHYLLIYKYIPGLWSNGFLTQHWCCWLSERNFICCESFKHYTTECKKLKTAIPSFLPSSSKCYECTQDLMLCLLMNNWHSILVYNFNFCLLLDYGVQNSQIGSIKN